MNIHILRTGLFRVNTLVVPLGGGRCFVVDPAACKAGGDQNVITDFLIGHGLTCIAIILTHSHFDHITGIAPIKTAFPNAKILIHKSEAAELSSPPGPMNNSVLRFFGMPELLDEVSKQPVADTLLEDGMLFEGWKVIHTPVHTPGSICLYNEAVKWLYKCAEFFHTSYEMVNIWVYIIIMPIGILCSLIILWWRCVRRKRN